MNRRIPNGTYGGVGGRRLAAFSYPILIYYINPSSVGLYNNKTILI